MTVTWAIELVQPLGGTITSLPGAKDPNLTLSLKDGHSFSFNISGFDPQAKLINEMFTDVVVYRDSDKVFRGRIVSATQSGDADGAAVTVSAVDYKTLLKRKFVRTAVTLSGDVEAVCWSAINTAQTGTRNLGILRGANQITGVTVTNFPIETGVSVYDLITKLTETNTATNASDCFEWDIDPDLYFKVYRPTRGKRTPTFLADFGGSVMSYDVQFDPNSYANVFYVQGNGAYKATVTTDEGRQPPPGGIFEEWLDDGNLTSTQLVDAKAFWMATFNGQLALTKTYNLELSNSRWHGPVSCWIGDFVILSIEHGIVNTKTDQMRVLDMTISQDVSGYESVAIGVGYAVPSTWRDYNRMSAFMRNLRSGILRRRANWYKSKMKSTLLNYKNQVGKHGKNSYQAKAALLQYKKYSRDSASYKRNLDFSGGGSSRF